jgi:CRP-like cAMP-binding protein
MADQIPNRPRNRVLASLSAADLALLQPRLESTPLKFRQRLQSANRQIKTVYFPESGLGSVVAVGGGEDRQAEVAIVGREGMTGVAVVHGAGRSPCEVFMQVEGAGHCIAASDLRAAMDQSPTLLKNFLLYAHVFAVQSGYTALANAQGKLEERLARWLLMAQDRIDGDELLLTHEFLSLMLGVRRAGVTTALQHFEGKGVIELARGCITILDREGLEDCANGLYGAPEAEFERLFPSGRA